MKFKTVRVRNDGSIDVIKGAVNDFVVVANMSVAAFIVSCYRRFQ